MAYPVRINIVRNGDNRTSRSSYLFLFKRLFILPELNNAWGCAALALVRRRAFRASVFSVSYPGDKKRRCY